MVIRDIKVKFIYDYLDNDDNNSRYTTIGILISDLDNKT